MKVKINEAKKISLQALVKNGFDKEVAKYCVENIVAGELTGKKTHGLIRVLHQVNRKNDGRISTSPKDFKVTKKTSKHLYINANRLPGFYSIYKSLEIAIPLAKKSKLFFVGIKNTDITGYIADYARIATEENLIFLAFNNSPGGLVPHGVKSASPWGTDPITFGIPTNNTPVIFDTASTMITWGDLMIARKQNNKISKGVAVDVNGSITTDPHKVVGLLPFSDHKGSGFAMMVEILAGVLTGSGVGEKIKGGWGSSYLLIDPTLFRPLKDFKSDMGTMIRELKSLPKAKDVQKIYYPGERSASLRLKNMKRGWIEVDDKVWGEIVELSK